MEVRRLKNDELQHHGVKGQQWGERNGPPYPLNATGRTLKKQQRIYKRSNRELASEDNAKNQHLKRKHLTQADSYTINRISDKRKKVIKQFNDLKMRATSDKSIKKTEQYKNLKKSYNRIQNSNAVSDGSWYISSSQVGISNDLNKFNHYTNNVYKKLKKYNNVLLSDAKSDSKKIEKARNKLHKAIEKSNKITMELADARITGYTSKNELDYDFIRNDK